MTTPLSSAAISAADLEAAAQRIINEFLKSYFDGAQHDLGTGPILLPLCEIGFNQMTPTLTKPLIHVVFARLVHDRDFRAPQGLEEIQVKVNTLINFFVRVPNAGQKQIGADPQCQLVANGLRMILDRPAERARMAAKGILHAKLEAGPTPQPFPGVQVRLLTVSAELIYSLT